MCIFSSHPLLGKISKIFLCLIYFEKFDDQIYDTEFNV